MLSNQGTRGPIKVDNTVYAHIAKRLQGQDLLSVKNEIIRQIGLHRREKSEKLNSLRLQQKADHRQAVRDISMLA